MLDALPIPAFTDNYIWLIHGGRDRRVAIVDPGDAEPVLQALDQRAMQPVAILITHHHGDHVGGIRRLLQHYDVPVYGPAQEHIPGLTHALREGDSIKLEPLGARFTVLDVPGHTAGHIAFYGHDMLFCGDTLFTGGCGKLFEGTPAQMHASLSKIAALPAHTRVYCAHEYTLANLGFAAVVEPGNDALHARIAQTRRQRATGSPTVPSTLEVEKSTNPFLRCHVPYVIAAAERQAGKALGSASEVFAILRHWKDVLDDKKG
ncbi:MAG: hydroxyacylglutathione hydrolase [Gammaproteobacteria bacterium]|nr:hydroxyacylglutathione hydrolase [Gammaproteobacteria bacterium]